MTPVPVQQSKTLSMSSTTAQAQETKPESDTKKESSSQSSQIRARRSLKKKQKKQLKHKPLPPLPDADQERENKQNVVHQKETHLSRLLNNLVEQKKALEPEEVQQKRPKTGNYQSLNSFQSQPKKSVKQSKSTSHLPNPAFSSPLVFQSPLSLRSKASHASLGSILNGHANISSRLRTIDGPSFSSRPSTRGSDVFRSVDTKPFSSATTTISTPTIDEIPSFSSTNTSTSSFSLSSQTQSPNSPPESAGSIYPPSDIKMDSDSRSKDLKGSKSCADLPKDSSLRHTMASANSFRSASASATVTPVLSTIESKSGSSPSSSSTVTPNATPSISQSAPFSPLSPSTNFASRNRNVSGQQHVLYPNPMAQIHFKASDPAEWTLSRVLNWLEYNKFGPDWIETFQSRNIHGSEFLSLVSYTKLKRDLGKDLGHLSTSNEIYSTTPSRFIQILRKVLDKSSSNTSQNSGSGAARESGIWDKDDSDLDNATITHDGFHSKSICPENPVYLGPSKSSSQPYQSSAAATTNVAFSNIQATHERHSTSTSSSITTLGPPSKESTKNNSAFPSPSVSPMTSGILRLPVQKHGSYDNLKEMDSSEFRVRSRSKTKSDPQILNINDKHFQNPHSGQHRQASTNETSFSNQHNLRSSSSSISLKHQVWNCFPVRY